MTDGGDDEPAAAARRDPDEPLGDLVNRVRERRGGSTDRDGSNDDQDPMGLGPNDGASGRDGPSVTRGAGESEQELFEEIDVDVGSVDADAVWESVLADEDDAGATDPAGKTATPEGTTEASDTGVGTADGDSDETVVAKRQYCQSCDFFTAPPEVACTYEGSEIVEIVDSSRFRVRNCPVVAGEVDTDGVGRAAEEAVTVETEDVVTGEVAVDDSE
jgi:hypothetical protein